MRRIYEAWLIVLLAPGICDFVAERGSTKRRKLCFTVFKGGLLLFLFLTGTE